MFVFNVGWPFVLTPSASLFVLFAAVHTSPVRHSTVSTITVRTYTVFGAVKLRFIPKFSRLLHAPCADAFAPAADHRPVL